MHTIFFYLHLYFILGSISFQSFCVVPLLSMTVSQRFGRFAIPFRVPLFFSPRMARVTAAETSSREGKRCPGMGSFNLWNKSNSGGLMSGLYGAWGNNSHSYLLSKSVTQTFPRCGRALSCKMSGPSPSKSGRFLCIFLAQFLHPVTIVRCCHTCSTRNSCHHNSAVIISEDHHSLDLWLRSSKFFWAAGRLDFSARLTAISTPVQSL